MLIAKKTQAKRLKLEIKQLRKNNRPLLKLMVDLYHWAEENLNKDIIVTMISRTQDEQDSLYKGIISKSGREYDKRPWKSPHQFQHAIDIRSKIYDQGEREGIVKYLNTRYNDTNYYGKTAMVHEVGNHGMHFHIQYFKV